jgi:hypothetical protein
MDCVDCMAKMGFWLGIITVKLKKVKLETVSNSSRTFVSNAATPLLQSSHLCHR